MRNREVEKCCEAMDVVVREVVTAKLKLKFQENVFKSLHLGTNILANLFSIFIIDFKKDPSL